MSAAPVRDVVVAVACRRWTRVLPEAEDICRAAARAALAAAGGAGEVSVVLADDARVRDLNRRYRKRDAATNVLAFALAERDAAPAGGPPALLGDVIVACETVLAEAAAAAKPVGDHLAHLVIHGTLHLLGYDHEDTAEARRMERTEAAALAGLGLADPYDAARPSAAGASAS